MKSALEQKYPDITIELIKSSGGRFEIVKDGSLIFSKKAEGRFPAEGEIYAALD